MREIVAIFGQEIELGKRGENNATCVVFDICVWRKTFGDGVVMLINQRNGDKFPYPCAVNVDGDKVYWIITNTEVATAGKGRCELQYWSGDTLAKSITFNTIVAPAMGVAGDVPPEPGRSWLEQLQGLAVDIEESVNTAATDAAERVGEQMRVYVSAALAAQTAAEVAAANAETVTAGDFATKSYVDTADLDCGTF